ncbi:MAG: urea transport system permease protein [Chitinophagales bacterium]|jgi:urea transport system permease protein
MHVIFNHSFIFLLLLFNISLSSATETDQALKLLTSSSFDDKSLAIGLLVEMGGDNSELLLNAMAQGDLYYVKSNKRIVLTKKQDSKIQLTDALTGEDLGLVSKRKVKKVSVNNRLRGQISTAISNFKLSSTDATIRLVAVENLMANASPKMLTQLQSIRQKEPDPAVIDAIDTVTAFSQLETTNIEDQLSAIEKLDGHLNPAVLAQLKQLHSASNDASVRLAAKKSIRNIESKVSIFGHMETLFFGLSLGSTLALAAIGLAITFGVMGVINMAHGELIMIGAYTTYVIQLLMPNHIGASLLVAIPAAFLVSALVGIVIERSVIRFLYGRPLETLLATFGISLLLQQAVRSIFSPLNRPVVSPDWMSGSLEINALLSITYNRLYIFFFCLAIFALLYLIMTKTSLGLHVRAISQNRPMARAMGVRSQWVDVMTFGLGSGIAGVAGVALSQITNVGPNLGQAYIVDSFMVVVFGGVGNLWGTLISGLTLGVVGKFLEPSTGAVLAKVLVLLFIILYIQKRPRGMFPQKGRAAGQ